MNSGRWLLYIAPLHLPFFFFFPSNECFEMGRLTNLYAVCLLHTYRTGFALGCSLSFSSVGLEVNFQFRLTGLQLSSKAVRNKTIVVSTLECLEAKLKLILQSRGYNTASTHDQQESTSICEATSCYYGSLEVNFRPMPSWKHSTMLSLHCGKCVLSIKIKELPVYLKTDIALIHTAIQILGHAPCTVWFFFLVCSKHSFEWVLVCVHFLCFVVIVL